MKKILLLSFVMMVALSNSYSQNPVPNSGFENWTSGNPDGWTTTNVPGFLTLVTQSSDAHTGSSCARGDVDTIFGNAVSPFLISGVNGRGFPVSQNYTTLEFWYKLNSVSGDVLDAEVLMADASGAGVGAGVQEFTTQSSYTHVAMPINYVTGTADTCFITFVVLNNSDTAHLGSYMEIDDVSLTNNPTGITQHNPAGFQSFSVFPNPAKVETTLRYFTVKASLLEISLYDVTGRKVLSSDHPTTIGMHEERLDVSELKSGIYLCALKTGNDVVKKMLSVIK